MEGIEQDITEEQFQELLKDQWWRLTHLYHIVNKKGQRVLFVPNKVQKDLYDNLWYCNIILKSRQHGVTTFFAILYLDICLFNSDISCGIVCHKEEAANEILEKKLKYAYKHLPEEVKAVLPKVVTDKANKLAFDNGSSIYCDCSLRSGTCQYLHISEYGPMCAKYPDRADEVKTGAFNTVQVGQYISVESTAYGMSGTFYDYCMEAIKLVLERVFLNPLQFKFHFYAWFHDPENVLEVDNLSLSPEQKAYFDKIELEAAVAHSQGLMDPVPGGKLSDGQKAWWVAKKDQQKDAMEREQPATPEEAFKASLEGLYYQKAFLTLYKEKRICSVPYERRTVVNTAWDLGVNDPTVIWFHQKIGTENRIIDYLIDDGEGLEYFVRRLNEKEYVYGTHFLPWDGGARRLAGNAESPQDVLEGLGLRNVVCVPQTKDLLMDIEKVRQFLPTCYFDKEKCSEGINGLENYRKEFDEVRRAFKAKPVHDWASHPSSAFATLARGILEVGTVEHGPSNEWLRNRKKPSMKAFH